MKRCQINKHCQPYLDQQYMVPLAVYSLSFIFNNFVNQDKLHLCHMSVYSSFLLLCLLNFSPFSLSKTNKNTNPESAGGFCVLKKGLLLYLVLLIESQYNTACVMFSGGVREQAGTKEKDKEKRGEAQWNAQCNYEEDNKQQCRHIRQQSRTHKNTTDNDHMNNH